MKGKQEEVDVTKEDQVYINEFSRLHAKSKALNGNIKKTNEVLEGLSDADTAIEEALGSTLKLSIGESFVLTNEDQAKEYVNKMKAKYNQEKKELVSTLETSNKRIDELKIILYAKFGQRLRLEED